MNKLFTPDSLGTPQAQPSGLTPGCALIAKDTVIHGEISKCECLEVNGYIEGTAHVKHVVIQPDGKVIGTLKAASAEIHGTFQGEISVSGLLKIGSAGSVTGTVLYGQIAMEQGANLSAEVRNIPPTLSGDLDITVIKNQSVTITTADLNAVDPDDDAAALTFTITQPMGGHIALAPEKTKAVTSFKQSDVITRKVLFVHDGKSDKASFKTMVTDGSGAKSGTPQTVTIHVK